MNKIIMSCGKPLQALVEIQRQEQKGPGRRETERKREKITTIVKVRQRQEGDTISIPF